MEPNYSRFCDTCEKYFNQRHCENDLYCPFCQDILLETIHQDVIDRLWNAIVGGNNAPRSRSPSAGIEDIGIHRSLSPAPQSPSPRFRDPTLHNSGSPLKFGNPERSQVHTPLTRFGGVTPCSDAPGNLAMPSTDQNQVCSPKKNGSSRLDKARKQDAYNQWKPSNLRDSKQGKKRQQMSRKIKRRLISAPVMHIIFD